MPPSYQVKNPLQYVQADSARTGFEDANGNRVYFIPAVDDCSRVVTAQICDSKSGDEAVRALERFIAKYGKSDQVQTDQGVEITNC